MALIKCPECGKEISDKASACIHCGCPQSAFHGNLIIRGRKEGFNKSLYYLYDIHGNFFDKVLGGEENRYQIKEPITLVLGHKRGSFLGCAVKDSEPVTIDPKKTTCLEACMTPGLHSRQYRLIPIGQK